MHVTYINDCTTIIIIIVLLQTKVDLGEGYSKGLESIFNAVDYLYTGQSKGKVVVKLNPPTPSSDTLNHKL